MTTIPAPHTTALTTELRYLALGDSYTIGESVDEAGRWPMQLARLLRMEGVLVGDPRIIATTGWTTDELDAAITAAEPLGQHDFVTLLIGVNNQYRGRDVEEYRTQFAALLWRAIGFAGNRPGRVLVLSIPDWGVTPFGAASGRDVEQISRELDAYNLAARTVCAQRDVAFVDITAVSRTRGTEPAMVADDGLHPSAAMYTEWTRLAFPVAHRLLA
ncbi:Lysophospholipase L1 [Pseudoxanthomonas sp. CF385]|uniref:SGNH/GDSL hydrolase family protein n=1 Tax=Pseudoxanthomonas sp. CF385 TaxID=1881042 RepID=UPI00088F3B8A|nr:SGNH/GDSL hydrolase family protein [Pseudoxanthomonas sp. CF385]SDQ29355.1 Lysophospholipase L1 [Pseudoxanthomonas sp. CF385]